MAGSLAGSFWRILQRAFGVLMIAGFLAVFGAFVWMLLFRPHRTPLVAVVASPYETPYPPLAWSADDLKNLASLHGENISLIEPLSPIRRPADVQDWIRQAARQRGVAGSETAIIYLSMHGVVDNKTPYLALPGSSPLDPSTWLPLEQALDTISTSFAGQNNLVVLDCDRIQMQWNLGLPLNDFAGALETWWSENQGAYPRIALLTSAGPGEMAWSSSEIGATAFGHYFRLGLAGNADGYGSSGIRDQQISIAELHQYVRDQVDAWAQQNRARPQRPTLLSGNNFRAVWALDKSSAARVAAEESGMPGGDVALTAKLNRYWRQLDDLRQAYRPYQRQPLAWRNLEHQLLSLERLSQAGTGYLDLAEVTSERIEKRLREIAGRVESAAANRSINEVDILLEDGLNIPLDVQVQSLPLARYFGSMSADSHRAATDEISIFLSSPNKVSLDDVVRRLGDKSESRDLIERRFLYMVQRYQTPDVWKKSDLLTRLLDVRTRADHIAAPLNATLSPGDERSHHWVRALLEDAEQSRRLAEDHFFAAGQPLLKEQLQQAEAKYQLISNQRDRLASAMSTRDQAWAEMAYLAQWMMHPLRTREAASAEAVQPADLVAAFRNAANLAKEMSDRGLVAGEPAGLAAKITTLNEQADNVAQSLAALRSHFETECRRLLSDPRGDAEKLREMEAIWDVPLMSWKHRNELRKLRDELSTRLARSAASPVSSESEDDSDADYQAWLDGFESHPMSLMVDPDGAVAPKQPQLIAEQWRLGVQDLLQNLKTTNEEAGRKEWSNLEQRFRAAASVWFPPAKTNPVVRLRQIDLRDLLVWHANRSFNDYWGPAGTSEAFFYESAEKYLKSAERLPWATPQATKDRIALLRQTSKLARDGMRDWADTTAKDVVRVDAQQPIEAELSVAVKSTDIPPGVAALAIRRNSQRLSGTRYQPLPPAPAGVVPLPISSPPKIPAAISPLGLPMRNVELDAMTIFRGHESRGPFTLRPMGGVRVDVAPHSYEDSLVTLHSPWKRLSVVILLDCSGSMGTLVDTEKSRLDMAKDALEKILPQLSPRRNVHVGVRFLGHRLGWSTDLPLRVMRQPAHPRDIDQDVTPESDVEIVAPLTTFGFETARTIYQELETVQPWGQSPIYYSLERTLVEDFANEPVDADKHVIVLTDGRDYLVRPTAENNRDVDDVIRLSQQSRTPIHIFGVAMTREQESGSTGFVRIANETGGIFRNIEQSRTLTAALREIMAPKQYQVKSAKGPSWRARLGAPVQVPKADLDADLFSIAFESGSQVVQLEGGEALDFFYDADTGTIGTYPYDKNVARTIDLFLNGQGTASHVARIHRPARIDQDVSIPISIQAMDARNWLWTARPKELWIEVQPTFRSGEKAPNTYIYYDVNFEPDLPVPKLNLIAKEWPVGAARAEVRLWFKGSTTQTTRVLPLSEALASPQNVTNDTRLVIDAKNVGGSSVIRVIEYHAESSGVGSIKVMLSGDAQPKHLERRFDQENGLAVHSFLFPETLEQLRSMNMNVEITSSALAKQQAWTSPDASVVNILESGFLPLTTPEPTK